MRLQLCEHLTCEGAQFRRSAVFGFTLEERDRFLVILYLLLHVLAGGKCRSGIGVRCSRRQRSLRVRLFWGWIARLDVRLRIFHIEILGNRRDLSVGLRVIGDHPLLRRT